MNGMFAAGFVVVPELVHDLDWLVILSGPRSLGISVRTCRALGALRSIGAIGTARGTPFGSRPGFIAVAISSAAATATAATAALILFTFASRQLLAARNRLLVRFIDGQLRIEIQIEPFAANRRQFGLAQFLALRRPFTRWLSLSVTPASATTAAAAFSPPPIVPLPFLIFAACWRRRFFKVGSGLDIAFGLYVRPILEGEVGIEVDVHRHVIDRLAAARLRERRLLGFVSRFEFIQQMAGTFLALAALLTLAARLTLTMHFTLSGTRLRSLDGARRFRSGLIYDWFGNFWFRSA
jgi:hypothetical protein